LPAKNVKAAVPGHESTKMISVQSSGAYSATSVALLLASPRAASAVAFGGVANPAGKGGGRTWWSGKQMKATVLESSVSSHVRHETPGKAREG
jgi:hypothetical protein